MSHRLAGKVHDDLKNIRPSKIYGCKKLILILANGTKIDHIYFLPYLRMNLGYLVVISDP